jgi:Protein kinase domain
MNDVCPRCGSPLDKTSLGGACVPCMLKAGLAPSEETTAPEDLEKTPLDRGRFVAGTLLAGRYRIVGLLGRGGMGEVYKAEDLKLRQIVALKFLPEELSSDGPMLARFHREVRAARQITHPNVCRVHDIGETEIGLETLQFLSMEYIDGEDLSALLRRIGHFPAAKALELARQLCAGLGAAHEAGMVHRDLKPANIMLDGRGRARITDFGLSGLAEELRGDEEPSGTPAYMAPEQLGGAPATMASDIYALGLVLYEIFTGKRPFEARTVSDVLERQKKKIPPPSAIIRSIDPLVESAILRCLSREPETRPKSTYEVAAALPGRDPLVAALAAGETPSPEMVAASGQKDGLGAPVAWTLLGAIACILLAVGWVFNPADARRQSFAKPPDVLAERARTILNQLGYPASFADSASGLRLDEDLEAWAGNSRHLASAQPGWIRFWYRESRDTLAPASLHVIGPFYAAPELRVSEDDPPRLQAGMSNVTLDSDGKLLEFLAVPVAGSSASTTVDRSLLLSMAGLSSQDLTTVGPTQQAIAGDQQFAWIGHRPDQPDVPLRVEAGFAAGRPVYFAVIGPWTHVVEKRPAWQEAVIVISTIGALVFIVFGGSLLAWRNVQSGRGDRRGAFRLALFAVVAVSLAWLLGSDHRFGSQEYKVWVNSLGEALVWSVVAGVMYLAVEPFARHRWPHALISWNRLIEGRFRDSLVARHVLVGIFFASIVCIVRTAGLLFHWSLPELPETRLLDAVQSNFRTASFVLGILVDSANIPLALFFLWSFFRSLGNQYVAVALWIVVLNVLTRPLDLTVPGVLLVSVFGALWLVSVTRFGLIAGMAMWFADRIFRAEIMLSPQSWYAGRMYLLLGIIAALAVHAFKMSLGNRPALSLRLMEPKE